MTSQDLSPGSPMQDSRQSDGQVDLSLYEVQMGVPWFGCLPDVHNKDRKIYFSVRVFASDVLLIILLEKLGGEPKRGGSCSHWADVKDMGERLIVRVDSWAKQVGLHLPCYCIISVDGDDDLRREVEGAASDQEWHRGAFAIQVADDSTQAYEHAKRLLRGMGEDEPMPELQPISPARLVERLESAIQSLDGPRRELLEVCKEVIAEQEGLGGPPKAVGLSPAARIARWIDERLAAAEKAGETDEHEDSEG